MPGAILAGIGWHILGAAMAASFYAPIGKVKNWSWETTWAVAGLFSWILLPIGVSLMLLPDFTGFYASMGSPLLLKVALFGAMWGVGNISYGLTMRHLGMSLGIGVAIGVTLVVGTLVPPLIHGQGAMLVQTRGGLLTLAGVIVAVNGVAIVSYAGHQKEVQLGAEGAREFNVKLGLLLAVMCGIFSSGHVVCQIDAARLMEAMAKSSLGVNSLYACGAAKLRDHHGRRSGGEPELLLYPAGRTEAAEPARGPGPTAADSDQECVAGGDGRNHVVSAVLLLRLGRGTHSGAAGVCELDAAYEHLRALRRTGGFGAGRVEGRREAASAVALGRSAGDYCGGESGGVGDGVLTVVSGQEKFLD